MTKRRGLAAIALAVAVSGAAPALASDDRVPTAEELALIEAALRGAGYTSWEEIDMDDGQWDVDDARRGDGHEYEVRIHPGTYEIVSERRED